MKCTSIDMQLRNMLQMMKTADNFSLGASKLEKISCFVFQQVTAFMISTVQI